jgi:hypothetical protein
MTLQATRAFAAAVNGAMLGPIPNVTNTFQMSQFGGACLVDRYLFLTPFGSAYPTGAKNSILVRFDTLDPPGITQSGSWQTVNLQNVAGSVQASGYQGALTDGPFLYLVPAYNGSAVPPFLRYDTTQALTDTTAWATMNGLVTTPTAFTLQAAFGASDGVYGYLGPSWFPTATGPTYGTANGGLYRWRLWPGPPDAEANRLGQSLNFWRDSSGYTGFGTKQPAEQVHSAANVRADGLLLGQMGQSGYVAQAETTPHVVASQALVANATPYTLASHLLPANALSAVNKGVRIRAFGGLSTTSTPDTMYVLTNLGTQTILTAGPVVASGTVPPGSWYLEATALLSGVSPASESCGGMGFLTPPGATSPTAFTSFTVGTQNPTNQITIAIQGSSSFTADIVLNGFSVDFIN